MREGFFGALAALLTGAGVALAQGPGVAILPPAPAPAVPPPSLAAPADCPAPPECVAAPDGPTLWVRAEYLLWWFKNSPLPVPLLTTTSDPDLNPTAVIGQPGTSVVLGNQDLGTGARHGARFTGGAWLDSRRSIGLEGGYFFLASHTLTRGVTSGGQADSPVLAVPFFDPDAGAESSFVLASPGTSSGGASLSLTSRLQGAEVNGAVRLLGGGGLDVQLLGGVRFLQLHEALTYATTSVGIQEPGDSSNNGLVLNTVDQFETENRFYGWQVGARVEYVLRALFVNAWAKVALGDSQQIATLTGSATTNAFNAPGGPFTGVPTQTFPGAGTFVEATNQGRTSRHQLAVVPEVGLDVGWQLPGGVRAFVGYDFLYLSSAIRPGDQVDRVLSVSQTVQNAVAGNPSAPGERPAATLVSSPFWVQGVHLGLEWRY